MKRIITLFLLTALIYSMVCPCFAANNEIVFSSDCGNTSLFKAGDTFTVNVCISENPGLWSFFLLVSYDKDVLSVKDISVPDELNNSGEMTIGKTDASHSDFKNTAVDNLVTKISGNCDPDNSEKLFSTLYYEQSTLEDLYYLGNIAQITFTVRETAENGKYTVSFCSDGYNNINCNEDELKVITRDVDIEIGDAGGNSMPGDVDGDGDVTNKDVLVLRKYLSGAYTDDMLVTGNADVNHDNEINNKDVLYIRQYLAGAISL